MNGSSSIQGNTAQVAGGVENGGTMIMRDKSTVRGNSATNYAGGIANAGTGTLRMLHSSAIIRNTTDPASIGGGLWNAPDGTLEGVRCAPYVPANVSGNTPDDCYPNAFQ
jgi:hypothetical protein